MESKKLFLVKNNFLIYYLTKDENKKNKIKFIFSLMLGSEKRNLKRVLTQFCYFALKCFYTLS